MNARWLRIVALLHLSLSSSARVSKLSDSRGSVCGAVASALCTSVVVGRALEATPLYQASLALACSIRNKPLQLRQIQGIIYLACL